MKDEIFKLVESFVSAQTTEKSSHISYGGRVYDETEVKYLVDAALEFWLTSGHYTETFEKLLSEFLSVKHVLFVNSGSSANLLAFMALTSPLLKERQIRRGDEVITVACCFPTTISPMIYFGAVPVVVDVDITTLNLVTSQLEAAYSSKTKAVMLAHTLGNPFNLKEVTNFCKKHNLWLIEDNCDSLGSKYDNQMTGSFGDIGTSSFYPSHHITTGEGGAVYTNNTQLYEILLSLRDWGRSCKCPPGKDNLCGKRFKQMHTNLPEGYDHKYIYSHLGFNLKGTDLQAAIGCAQMEKLPQFIKDRQHNYNYLKSQLQHLGEFIQFQEPEVNSDPSWFGFAMTLKSIVSGKRTQLISKLESGGVQTRVLFAGNILNHPCCEHLVENQDYRVVGSLKNSSYILNNTFWCGVYPKLKIPQLTHIVQLIRDFFERGV